MYNLEDFNQVIKSKSKIFPQMTYQEILAKHLRMFFGTEEEIASLKEKAMSEFLRYKQEYVFKTKEAKLHHKKAIEELGPIFLNALLLQDKISFNTNLNYFEFLWKAVFKFCKTFIVKNIEYIDLDNNKICKLVDLKDEEFLKEIEPRINFHILLMNKSTAISDCLLIKIIPHMSKNTWSYRKIRFSESQIQKFGNQLPYCLFYFNSSLKNYAVEKLYSEMHKK